MAKVIPSSLSSPTSSPPPPNTSRLNRLFPWRAAREDRAQGNRMPLSQAVRFSKQASREVPVAEFVPYRTLIAPDALITDKGDLLRTWKLDGVPFESVKHSTLDTQKDALNELIRGLGGNRALWTHEIHMRTHDALDGTYPPGIVADFARDYARTFDNYPMMSTELFVSVVHRPDTALVAKVTAGRGFEATRAALASELEKLDEGSMLVDSSLKRYGARRLGTVSKPNPNVTHVSSFGSSSASATSSPAPASSSASTSSPPIVFSELLGFLGSLVNGVREPIPVVRANIQEYLPTTRMIYGLENIELRFANGDTKFCGILDIADYPADVVSGILNPTLYEDFEYIKTQSFSTLSKHAAVSALQQQKGYLISAGDASDRQIAEFDEMVEQVVEGKIMVGDYHFTLAIFGASVEEVNRNCARARAALQEQGFQTKRIDLIADAAWFAQSPCNWQYRPRKAQLTSRAFAALSPFHSINLGKRDGNPWGECVTILKTPSGKPFYFNFHASPENEDVTDDKYPGTTLIIGQIGSGKTALEGALLMLAQKFNVEGAAFDKDAGLEIVIRALGGSYARIERGVPTGMNPFQALQNTPGNILFLTELVKQLVKGRPLTTAESTDIERAVSTVMGMEPPLRGLSMVLQILPNHDQEMPYYRLAKWCGQGAMAWVFDNRIDVVGAVQAKWIGYDYTQILDDPVSRTPIMMYLMHTSAARKKGQPFMTIIAEFWKAFEDPYFEEYAKNGIKAERKKDAIVVLDTQSPSDALDSNISKTLVEQTVTKIFLPNPEADAKDYIEGFKLTPEEYQTIRSLGAHSRTFLIKQGHQSWLAKLDLSHPLMQRYLTLLSSTTDNVHLLDEIRKEVGDDPEVWAPILMQQVDARRAQKKAA
jgi:type IV secretion system protein VirB4